LIARTSAACNSFLVDALTLNGPTFGTTESTWRTRPARHCVSPAIKSLALKIVSKQFAKSAASHWCSAGSLNDIDVRSPVALYETRAVIEECDIPPDQNVVMKGTVSLDGQIDSVFPHWQCPAGYQRPSVGMSLVPFRACTMADVGSRAKPAGSYIDGRRHTAGMEIVDRGRRVHGHAEGGMRNFEIARFIPYRNNACRAERAGAEV
jgi:hypothetical protein